MQGTTFVPFLFAYPVVWGHWSHRSGWITARLKQKYYLPTTTVIARRAKPEVAISWYAVRFCTNWDTDCMEIDYGTIADRVLTGPENFFEKT